VGGSRSRAVQHTIGRRQGRRAQLQQASLVLSALLVAARRREDGEGGGREGGAFAHTDKGTGEAGLQS